MTGADNKLIRIGVFYDGNYFLHVSNYYQYYHERHARISISGLHNFVRQKVAENEGVDAKHCQVVDAHYFRGRIRAQVAPNALLIKERIFDDVLMKEGVTTHYLPLGPEGEKGIDVWLALEAYELAMFRHFDVTVLVACDGDFLPLVRKLNSIGTRIMLLAWDFKAIDQNGRETETKTAQVLLNEVAYPLMMHQIIEDMSFKKDSLINGLFLPRKDSQQPDESHASPPASPPVPVEERKGTVLSIKEGYGFIGTSKTGKNFFFHHSEVLNVDFADLSVGDPVSYEIGENERGDCAVKVRSLLDT